MSYLDRLAVIDTSQVVTASLTRAEGNANFPCAKCRRRRVRYVITIQSLHAAMSTPRCLECWTGVAPSADIVSHAAEA